MTVAQEFCEKHCRHAGTKCILKNHRYICPVNEFVDYVVRKEIMKVEEGSCQTKP